MFKKLDGRIRKRLRGILRKRHNISGRAYTTVDNRRWPNAYFANAGLYSMTKARQLELESLRKGTH